VNRTEEKRAQKSRIDKAYRERPDIKEKRLKYGKEYYKRLTIEQVQHRKKYGKIYSSRPEKRVISRSAERKRWAQKSTEQKQKKIEYNRLYCSKPENRERRLFMQREWKNRRSPEQRLKDKLASDNKRFRRRLAMKSTDITSIWLKQLWESATHCVLCGKQMEDNGSYPNGKNLDHMLPLCVGGTHEMSNVRYICAKCNITRPKNGSDLK
jgi:hypothetical protein